MPTKCSVSMIIRAPRDKVFDLLTDFSRFNDVDEAFARVDFLTSKRRGLGTKTRWRLERWGTVEERDEEIVAWQENVSYTYRVITPPAKECTVHCQDVPTGTRVTFTTTLYEDDADTTKAIAGMWRELEHVKEYLES
ncbi:MAG: SRPBCC family protein [Candidatus Ranarchaeia archaeon]